MAKAKEQKIEYLAPDVLIPYANNARTHSAEQVQQIAASIKEFGFTNPVLIDDGGGIIAGHGRVKAAQLLKMDAVPCLRLSGLTKAQIKAYILADNKLALNAGWDENLLKIELKGLADLNFDLSLTGFSDLELSKMFPETVAGLTDEDETPEPPKEPISVLGDVWVLGKHRVMCGDSTVETDVRRLLSGAEPNLMVTYPPYGVEYDPEWRKRAGINKGGAMGKVKNDGRADWSEAWALFPGNIAYVWHAGRYAGEVQGSLEKCGFSIRNQIIWAKSQIVFGRGDYHWQHEPCWYAVRSKGNWTGDRKQSTLWQIDKPMKSETGHSTQKPVECMRRPIENNSNPGQIVYDPFLSSGTTVIAAEQTGRICYGMELNPAVVS